MREAGLVTNAGIVAPDALERICFYRANVHGFQLRDERVCLLLAHLRCPPPKFAAPFTGPEQAVAEARGADAERDWRTEATFDRRVLSRRR